MGLSSSNSKITWMVFPLAVLGIVISTVGLEDSFIISFTSLKEPASL